MSGVHRSEVATSGQQKFESIQILRGLAALGVVVSHAHSRYERAFPELTGNSYIENVGGLSFIGHAGVDLFFVISGFIMIYVHFDDFGKNGAPRRFFIRRIKRIVPIYWILTTVALAAIIIMPQLSYHNRQFDWLWTIGSYFFFPVRSETGVTTPLIGPGWTLNYEMYFYIIFSVFLFFDKKYLLPGLTILFGSSVIIGGVIKPHNLSFIMITNWLLLQFLLGCIIGLLFKKGVVINRMQAFFMMTTGCIVLIAWVFLSVGAQPLHGASRFFWWGVPTAMILASVVLGSYKTGRKKSAILTKLGDASYSIYLTHIFSLPLLAIILGRLAPFREIQQDFATLLLTFVSCIVGYVFFECVERPIGKKLARMKAQSS